MDFEQELQELIDAALEAGVSRDAIISVLEERAAVFKGQEDDEAKEAEEDADDTP